MSRTSSPAPAGRSRARRRRDSGPPDETREAKKERTRRRLLDAALDLMSDDRNFSMLSLRKVARRAGLTPNGFYRHFESMEELGLALVDENGPTLRRLLREVRKASLPQEEIVRRSVDVYKQYVRDQRRSFSFVVRERVSGPPRIRAAIRREMDYFSQELAADLMVLATLTMSAKPSHRSIELLADLIVRLILGATDEILEITEDDVEAEDALTDRLVHQLVMVILGATAWLEGQCRRDAAERRRSDAPAEIAG